MSFKQDELEFWLPSDVLADEEDTLMDTKFRGSDSVSSRFLLPTNGGSALSSPGKSVVGSTETESDEDVFLFSELTRQLSLLDGHKFAPTRPTHDKNYVHSGSPQSTLLHVESFSGLSNGSTNGSPNGPSQVSSPPTTPLASNNSSWDLIYKAAGLVEALKSNSAGGLTPSNPPATIFQRQGSFSTLPPPKSSAVYPNYHVPNEELLGRDGYGIRTGQVRNGPNNLTTGQKLDGLAENSGGWPPYVYSGYPNNIHLQNKNQLQLGPGARGCGFHFGGGYGGVGHGYGYGSGNRVRVGDVVKSERVGTGVFLPRRYEEKNSGNPHCSNAVDTRKKSGNSSAYSAKKMVPIMSKNLNNKSAFTECQSKKFGCDTIPDYDALLARKMSVPVSVSTLQRKTVPFPEVPIHHEICLPQEWTY